jgi:hypothetical protein
MTAQEKTWPSAVDGFILTEEKKIHYELFQSKLFYSRHKYLAAGSLQCSRHPVAAVVRGGSLAYCHPLFSSPASDLHAVREIDINLSVPACAT